MARGSWLVARASGDVLEELRYESRYVVNFCEALQATRNILGVFPVLRDSALIIKTVLFRIISIVRVPSLYLNKDTNPNHDDETWCCSLSVKLLSVTNLLIGSLLA